MKPEDLKLKSGIRCIDVDEEARLVSVIVPEGWTVFVMTSDSGQRLESAETTVVAAMLIRLTPPTER